MPRSIATTMRARSARPTTRIERYGPLVVHAAFAATAVMAALACGRDPATCEPLWSAPTELARHGTSLALGVVLGGATIHLTRVFVRRFAWARELRDELRSDVLGKGACVVLGIGAAASEELFFRGLCTTTIGLVLSSLFFGLLHGAGGAARWAWMTWATVMGLAFGALFVVTGSLAGPFVAHAMINVVNARLLRDDDVALEKPRLAGWLGRA